MRKLNEILRWATSDLAVAVYAAIIAGVLLAKGVTVIGGAGLGIACVKLWSAVKTLIE